MCLRYAETVGGKEGSWDCSEVDLEGTRITWTADGEKTFSNLIVGNPNGY